MGILVHNLRLKMQEENVARLLLISICSIVAGVDAKTDIRGRLALMLCMQYNLEGKNFSSKAPPKPHKGPIYQSQDAPCRTIRWSRCKGDKKCRKFSSYRKNGCEDEMSIIGGEYGTYFQGDLVNFAKKGRAGLKPIDKRWPNRTKVGDASGQLAPYIAYEFAGEFSEDRKTTIRAALGHIERCTCLRFEEKQDDPLHEDFVRIESSQGGCFTYELGRKGGSQMINLNEKCIFGTIVHEFLHIIGFHHEQSRPDRDQYVKIRTERITPKFLPNFDQLPAETWTNMNENYDYSSIMHYNRHSFALQQGEDTIEPLDPSIFIGQREALSRSDILQINRMHECSTEPYPGCVPYEDLRVQEEVRPAV